MRCQKGRNPKYKQNPGANPPVRNLNTARVGQVASQHAAHAALELSCHPSSNRYLAPRQVEDGIVVCQPLCRGTPIVMKASGQGGCGVKDGNVTFLVCYGQVFAIVQHLQQPLCMFSHSTDSALLPMNIKVLLCWCAGMDVSVHGLLLLDYADKLSCSAVWVGSQSGVKQPRRRTHLVRCSLGTQACE